MRRLVLVLILFGSTANAIERDKALHFGVSAAISTSVYTLFRFNHTKVRSVVTAMAFTMAVGLSKECSDTTFDKNDLAYDLAGAMVPLLLVEF